MLELGEWMASIRFPDKPWLVLGKGPTFSRRSDFDLDAYNTLGLNHVVREVMLDVAHAIDVDVVTACADVLLDNCRWLVMPRRPHTNNSPGPLLLEDYLQRVPVLRELDEQGRLVWYSAATAPVAGYHTIGVRYFSAEAAFNILAAMGVKEIRSLGLDGGSGYSAAFSDLEDKTMLANQQPSFDLQFAEIDKTVDAHAIDYQPLIDPMRVFAGCDESQLVAAQVLEHSMKQHASGPVHFTPMIDLPIPTPKDPANRPRTGFSFYRFAIPKLCGHKGRALYVDADMQVFGDLAELWEIPFGDHKVLCAYQDAPPEAWKGSDWFHPGRQMSVMMLDCSRLDWDVNEIVAELDEGRYNYRDLMFDLSIVRPEEIGDTIPPEWNSLEHYEAGKTKLVHYTVVPTQPWKSDDNPLASLWEQAYRDALVAGAVDPQIVRRLVDKGHIKPSLESDLPTNGASLRDRGGGAARQFAFRVSRRLKTTPGIREALRLGLRSWNRIRRAPRL